MVVVAGDLAKWREVGVEGSDQGNFGTLYNGGMEKFRYCGEYGMCSDGE